MYVFEETQTTAGCVLLLCFVIYDDDGEIDEKGKQRSD